MDLSRQSLLVPQDKIEKYTIKIYGVGSVGSHVAMTLAKTGFKNIELYDMDIVDTENISPQCFLNKHIKQNKVDALAEYIEEATGYKPDAFHGEINSVDQVVPEPDTIYMCFFDSFEGRQIIFDAVKDYPSIFVDGRIGRFDMRHYLIDMNNEEHKQQYADSLKVTANAELACGEKASAPINVQLAGTIVMNIINYISEKDYSNIMILNAQAPKTSMYGIVRVTPDEEPSSPAIESSPVIEDIENDEVVDETDDYLDEDEEWDEDEEEEIFA